MSTTHQDTLHSIQYLSLIMSSTFDPTDVDLTTADPTAVICYLNAAENEYDGRMGARISALFVILIVSSSATFFPVLAARSTRFKVPIYVYLFARYFGAGVIVATAFIHLLDPAYSEIGPQTCVGMTGNWASYAWPPAIMLVSVMLIFLMDFSAERYVEIKYDYSNDPDIEGIVTAEGNKSTTNGKPAQKNICNHANHMYLHAGDQNEITPSPLRQTSSDPDTNTDGNNTDRELFDKQPALSDVEQASCTGRSANEIERSFRTQIAAFLILEFGVIVHSIIIGLNLGTSGSEFSTLYPVIVFHQSFEGLGIGARMSSIPFPKRLEWTQWALCAGYGLTTPIAIAIGLGLRTTYNSGSFAANVVSGVLDSTSAGILMYTGLVELLARDFLFNPERTKDSRRLTFMVVCVFLGAAVMALLGKWA